MCRERIEESSGSLKLGACGRDVTLSFASGALLGSVRPQSALPSLPRIFLAGERRRRTASEEEEKNWMDGHLSDGCKGVSDEFLMSTLISAIRLPTLIYPHSTLF